MSMVSKIAGVLSLGTVVIFVLLGIGAIGEGNELLADRMFGGAGSVFVAGVLLLAFAAHLEHLEAIRRAVDRTFGAQALAAGAVSSESKPAAATDVVL